MPTQKATQCVHAGQTQGTRGMTSDIQTATSFRFLEETDEVVYPRYFNVSNQKVVAGKIAALENGEQGLVLGSGMAAIVSVLMALLKQGDHAVIHGGVYGGTRSFCTERLPEYGVDRTFVDGCDLQSFESQLRENTKVLLFESPTNPLLQIVDIRAVARLAAEKGIVTILDNTFATPILQNPLDLGIDVVVHSGTKYLNGHSDVNCGAVVTSAELMAKIVPIACQFGGTLDVRGCYLLERGLKTLALRVQRQCENAGQLAQALAAHRRVRAVNYPGLAEHPGREIAAQQMRCFGAMMSFELDTDAPTAKRILSRLQVATPAVSLGGVETILCFPKDTSHAKISAEERASAGISDTLVRLSVGIEDIGDLLADFEQALEV